MFLETTPERKIYKELAADHFGRPQRAGKVRPLSSVPPQGDLIPAPQMEPSLLLSGRATGPSPWRDATSLPPGTSTPFSSTWRETGH